MVYYAHSEVFQFVVHCESESDNSVPLSVPEDFDVRLGIYNGVQREPGEGASLAVRRRRLLRGPILLRFICFPKCTNILQFIGNYDIWIFYLFIYKGNFGKGNLFYLLLLWINSFLVTYMLEFQYISYDLCNQCHCINLRIKICPLSHYHIKL